MNYDREKIMTQWDKVRKLIAKGDKSSYPRDWFESVLDYFEKEFTLHPDCYFRGGGGCRKIRMKTNYWLNEIEIGGCRSGYNEMTEHRMILPRP